MGLRQLRPQDVLDLLYKLRDDGASQRTMSLVRTYLNMALDEAVGWRQVEFNVGKLVEVPRAKEQREARTLDPAQAGRLLDAIAGDRLEIAWLLGMRGLRPGETCGARWQDITDGVLHIEQARKEAPNGAITFGNPKRDQKRTLALDAGLLAALGRHKAAQATERLQAGSAWHDNDLIVCTTIGTPIDRTALRRLLVRATTKAGLGSDWHPTDLRRSYASLAAFGGSTEAEVAADLGHRGSRVTLAHYVRDVRDVRGGEGAANAARVIAQARQQATGTD
jgi:integrase